MKLVEYDSVEWEADNGSRSWECLFFHNGSIVGFHMFRLEEVGQALTEVELIAKAIKANAERGVNLVRTVKEAEP